MNISVIFLWKEYFYKWQKALTRGSQRKKQSHLIWVPLNVIPSRTFPTVLQNAQIWVMASNFPRQTENLAQLRAVQTVRVERSSCILNHIDRMAAVLNGHQDASGIQDGVIVGSFQHLRPGVTPIIWDIHIRDHHWDGIPHATCNTIPHLLSTNQQWNRKDLLPRE